MEIQELEAQIEAILFTMGEAVEAERIAQALEQETDTIRQVARNMMKRYHAADRGIQIIELNDSFQMSTKQTMYETIIKIAHVPKKHVLTEVLLETLSIVAYKQPITKQEVEAIRGVSCEHAINKLVEYRLIAEIGRLDAPGRPIMFGTTEEFLRNFGMASLEELPIVKPEKIQDFKLEAEEEIHLKLDV
ncbi:MAG: SMC-Scp complex subunit ScpB [Lachnospiraceae bacterium]|nr:SMC-Scp complex subunit ScpB [Lachnospiraceae bacterium]